VTSDTIPPAGTQASGDGRTAPTDPAAVATATDANKRNGEPRGWAETTRPIRWALALALVLAAWRCSPTG